MEKSRVEKFKEYREMLQSESFEAQEKDKKDISNLETGKLPLDYVIEDSEIPEKQNFKDWIERNYSIIKLIAIVIGLCALVVVIILLAIYIGRA